MTSRRIIAVSPDPAFGAQIAASLRDAGHALTVEEFHSSAELGTSDLGASLAAIHFDGEVMAAASAVLARLGADCRVIAILPRSNLAAIVRIMETSLRVSAMMVAEDIDHERLTALGARLLSGDIFGLDKAMEVGTPIHSEVVGDFAQKSECMQRIASFVERDVPRAFHESIEQCVDEMLMNALYDAPVDTAGKHVFAGISARTRIGITIDQDVVVQYAFDGKQFAIGVRDAFGSLDRATVLRVLDKCLHAKQKIDRRVSGAGVGLYLMVASATRVYFNVIPGVATEVICAFDITRPPQLCVLGFLAERTDVTGRLVAAPRLAPGAVKPPREPLTANAKLGRAAILVAILVAIGLVGYALIKRALAPVTTAAITVTTSAGAAIEIEGRPAGTASSGSLTIGELEIGHAYAIVAKLDGFQPNRAVVKVHAGSNPVALELHALPATVQLDSDPPGATVVIDGKSLGETPFKLTTLAPRTKVAVTFKKLGYVDATETIDVPVSGETKIVTEKLAASDAYVRVHFVSQPPGAQVIRDGVLPVAADRIYTPVDIVVEADKPQRFMLVMPAHVPFVIEPFTPARGAGTIEKSGTLADGATLHVEGSGVVTVSNAPHCTKLPAPVDCVLAPGTYTVELAPPNGAKRSKTITVTAVGVDASVKF